MQAEQAPRDPKHNVQFSKHVIETGYVLFLDALPHVPLHLMGRELLVEQGRATQHLLEVHPVGYLGQQAVNAGHVATGVENVGTTMYDQAGCNVDGHQVRVGKKVVIEAHNVAVLIEGVPEPG